MAKEHGSQIKNDDKYEALRREGHSKEAAARIANAGKSASKKGGKHPAYEDWTVNELRKRASELDMHGYSKKSKSELIRAIRDR